MAAITPYLQVDQLSKSFGDLLLFDKLSFGISHGQRVALIAKNGAGKSTLLSILSGIEAYESGKITFRRDLNISYLLQDPVFDPTLSVIEACFATDNEILRVVSEYERIMDSDDHSRLEHVLAQMELYKAWDYELRAKQILSKLNITRLDQPIGELSGGQKKRVALANALITEPDFLILDEPTNHLDVEMTEWLEEYLTKSNMTLLMVTHDRYFLDRVCNSILEIDHQSLYSYKGNYSYYLEKRQERIEQFKGEVERANNLYKTELDWMRRQPQARATKAKYRIDAFYEIEAKAKQRRLDNQVMLSGSGGYIGSKIFEAEHLYKKWESGKVILNDFNYVFSRYEKLGIIGHNGTGKSTFIKIIQGLLPIDNGILEIGDTVKFGYYSQDGLLFDEQMKVIDVIRNIADEIPVGDGKSLSASQFLQHFLFAPEVQHNYVYKLSGGEKRRLYLCTVLMHNPNFLILDEPTNDLDIVTLNVLEEYLIHFKGCVIVISHDRYFMDKVVDHLFVFEGDGVIMDFPGNYSDYRLLKELQEQEQKQIKPTTTAKQPPQPLLTPVELGGDDKKKLSFKLKRELEQIELEMPTLECRKSLIEKQMSSGALSNEQLMEAANEITSIIDRLNDIETRWLELSEYQ